MIKYVSAYTEFASFWLHFQAETAVTTYINRKLLVERDDEEPSKWKAPRNYRHQLIFSAFSRSKPTFLFRTVAPALQFFLIYINDLHTAIKHSKVYHFADDTSILNNIDYSLKKINKQCNHDLKLLCEWLRANKISLNTQKSEIIVFRSKQKSKINKTLNFRLSGQKMSLKKSGQKMSLKKSVKYLGIHLDEHLMGYTHGNHTPKT